MINVSVKHDIRNAMRALDLVERSVERAAWRALNKTADQVKLVSARAISSKTGLTRKRVNDRLFVRPASQSFLQASVHALPSSRNIGYYDGASPRQTDPGVNVKAWGKRNLYDRAFVMGPRNLGSLRRKVYRRTGPGDQDITDKVWGPSVRRTFLWKDVQATQLETVRQRWPVNFERYLRAEVIRTHGRGAIEGMGSLLPALTGPVVE